MQPNQESKDLESLRKFWHWADNEHPSRELFDAKASAEGPLTEEAQEAMQEAVQIVSLRSPSCLHLTGEVLRPMIKHVSLCILQAWQMLSEDERIQKALSEEQTRDFNVNGTLTAYFPGVTMTPISGCLDSFCGEEVTISFPGTDLPEKKGTLSKAGNGIYDFKALTGKAMFTGKPDAQDRYALCEYECNRIMRAMDVSDVQVTVDKKDGRVMFYHTKYTSMTYTVNYAPTVSSECVREAINTLRKAAKIEDERLSFI